MSNILVLAALASAAWQQSMMASQMASMSDQVRALNAEITALDPPVKPSG